MTGSAFHVGWYRLRGTLRRRWGGYLALAVLIGLVGGVAMGSLVAARRTDSSYPDLLAATNPSDLLVLPSVNTYAPGIITQLARLPHVRNVQGAADFNAATLGASGHAATLLMTQVELIASTDGLFTSQDRLIMTQGRAANPARLNEVVATTEAAAILHLHVGSRIGVGIVRNGAQNAGPFYRKLALTVTGIGAMNIQLVHDQVDTNRAGFLIGTPALARAYGPCCATNSYDGLQLAGGSRGDTAVMQEYESAASRAGSPGASQLVVYITSAIEAEAQRAIRPEAIALGVFGLIAGLATVIIGIQSISRQLRAGAGDTAVLRALGAGPAVTAADGLPGILGAVAAGALLAAVVTVALSPLTLFGPVQQVEPAGGVYLDWTVLGLGPLALAAVLGGLAVVIGYRLAPHRAAARPAGARASGIARAAQSAGLPPPAVAGVRFALEPGRGRTEIPVRAMLAGAVLATCVVAATLTFAASLNTLISRPALYGWNFSYALFSVDGYGSLPPSWTGPLLRHDPLVEATTGVYFATVQIDGQTVPAMAGPVRPRVGPQLLSGRGVTGPREIVLGPDTLAALGKRVGQTVTVSEGRLLPGVALRIVGTAALPTIGDNLGIHTSMSTGAYFPVQVVPPADLDQYGPISGPNAMFVRLRPGVSQQAGLRYMQEVTYRLNADARTPQAEAVIGNIASYFDPVTLLPVQRPAEIVNYKSMGAMPAVLAGGLAAGAVGGLGLALVATVRRRRRDFALLKTLGFTHRQLAGAVSWQASVIAVTGLVVGVPVGIAAGRWLWLAFARELAAVPDPVIPAGSIALAAVAALVLANLVAALPGRAAARTPAAIVLRAE
ncbi:MAG TPA: FtsX-like permease family protein [Streptosporangiaceae bacterium]|nr:FtsX-like permease family protein [Streptosporangiaceae bacterium]